MNPRDESEPVYRKDLAVGKVYDGIELIIHSDNDTMNTIACQRGKEDVRDYDITSFFYDLFPAPKEGMVFVRINGHGEVFPGDKMHDSYVQQLKAKELWYEDED